MVSTEVRETHSRETYSAPEAFARLGVGKVAGYRAIKTGEFPVPVFKVGGAIRVPKGPLDRLLGTATTTVPDETLDRVAALVLAELDRKAAQR